MPSLEDLRQHAPIILGVLIVGYLLGSLPFGYLVARAHGVNIFEAGSKSPGATNVKRVLGERAGNTVFVLDTLKGIVATGWPLLFGHTRELAALGVFSSLVGHAFSCFTHFRGGKGIATGAGGFLILMPLVTIIGAVVWIALFFSTGYVSLASIAAAISLPLAGTALRQPRFIVVIASIIAVLVLYLHRANLSRLAAGTEHRRGVGPKPPV
jgi:glycerol-3-phosphate acyltransferase PlsY